MVINNIQYEIKQLVWEDIVKLYNTNMQCDFPKEEIKTLELLQNLYDKGISKVYGVYEKAILKAYAIFEKPKNDNVILLDYLAVHKMDRGTGLGGRFVKEFKNIFYDVDGIVAEIEDISKASSEEQEFIRTRRKQFYLKNEFYETGVLTQADGGVDYEILYMPVGQKLKKFQIQKAMERMYSTFFKKGDYIVRGEF